MFYIGYSRNSENQPWFSPDGLEWQPADFPPVNVGGGIKYFNNRLFSRALGGVWATDTEGNNWTRVRSFNETFYTSWARLEVNDGKLYASADLGGSSGASLHWYSTTDGDTWVQETSIGLEDNRELIAGNWYDADFVLGDRYINVRKSPGEKAFASYLTLPGETTTWYSTGRRFYSRGWSQPNEMNTHRYEDPPGSGQLHTITGWGPNSVSPELVENSYAVLSLSPMLISPVAGFPDFRPATFPAGGIRVVGDHFTAQFGNVLYQSLDGLAWEARELPGSVEIGEWGALLLGPESFTKISFNLTRWVDIPPIPRGQVFWNGVPPVQPGTGQWPYRQRQSLGASGYPYRQRQNGGNTGSYPYRQRQRGL